jgi:hypothetical protein
MHAPALSRKEGRDLLNRTLQEGKPELELDRDIFEAVFKLDFKPPFDAFCETGIVPPEVVNYCQGKLWRNKL